MPPSTPEPNVLCEHRYRPWAQHRPTFATKRPDAVRYCPGRGVASQWVPAPVPERVAVDTETHDPWQHFVWGVDFARHEQALAVQVQTPGFANFATLYGRTGVRSQRLTHPAPTMPPSVNLDIPCRTCGMTPANHRLDDGACRPSVDAYIAAAPLRGRDGQPIPQDEHALWQAAYWALTTTRYGADDMPASWAPIRRALQARRVPAPSPAPEYDWPREVQQVPVPFPDDRVDAAVYGFSRMALSNASPGERSRWDRVSSGDILRDMEAAALAMRTANPSAPMTWAAGTRYSRADVDAAQGTVTGRLSMSGQGVAAARNSLPTNEAIAAKQPTEPGPLVTSDGPRAAPELDGPRAEAPGADIHAERYAAIELD